MDAMSSSHDEISNLKDGYEQIKTIYQIQAQRLKTSDEKLNMLLVFNAAIIASLLVVVPFPKNEIANVVSIILFSGFIISMLLTIFFIFIGLFPRKMSFIAVENFTDANQYNCTREEYIGKFMMGYRCAIDEITNVAEKKQIMIKHSMIASVVNTLLIVSMMLIKVI